MKLPIRAGLVALALAVALGAPSMLQAGPVKEPMETIKKAWKDASVVDEEVKRVEAKLSAAQSDDARREILRQESATAQAELNSVESQLALPPSGDLRASAANLRKFLSILRTMKTSPRASTN